MFFFSILTSRYRYDFQNALIIRVYSPCLVFYTPMISFAEYNYRVWMSFCRRNFLPLNFSSMYDLLFFSFFSFLSFLLLLNLSLVTLGFFLLLADLILLSSRESAVIYSCSEVGTPHSPLSFLVVYF